MLIGLPVCPTYKPSTDKMRYREVAGIVDRCCAMIRWACVFSYGIYGFPAACIQAKHDTGKHGSMSKAMYTVHKEARQLLKVNWASVPGKVRNRLRPAIFSC